MAETKFDPITVIKVALTVLLLGIILYLVIKYWKWFEAGAGLIAVGTALPFLKNVIAGIFGVGSAIFAAAAAFIKKRFDKAEKDKEGKTEEEKEQIDAEAKQDVSDTVDTMKTSVDTVPPGYEGKINVGTDQASVSGTIETDDPEGASEVGEQLADEGGNSISEFTPEE